MPFYEIIYETGAHSVACYADDAEAASAVKAHHERAKSGELGGPSGQPAERIVKVLRYDEHPNEYNPDQTMSAEVAAKQAVEAVKAVAVSGVVSVPELAASIRNLSSPLLAESAPHDSNYKMKEVGELQWQ